ncbi:heme-binding domain-containing protein [Granulicella sp. dw_53]|uniref:heme-binding domain-containing protein n=1 Tax=Granulicella sp. dw_53 TaxID=2719792 RepID=UPI001BD2F3D8|nr:heme-binding domain-containing protein [Granulicella sp. dw_53]
MALASRAFLWTGAVVCLGFAVIQLIRPELKNPPVTAEIQAPEEVRQILRTSCYSCHSNETKLPWFDQIEPAYWLVTKDVKKARRHLNFSEFGKLPAAQQKGLLFEAVNQIQMGAMPLPRYLKVHPEAKVTQDQVAVLRNYLVPPSTASAAPAAAADTTAGDAQYGKWIKQSEGPLEVQKSPNGIAFLPDYKNWKTISSTDRFDGGTLREIMGNDVAVKAIADNHINPWPDGTVFAKVAWFEQPDGQGVMRTGAFYQVEYMIRDSKKYASTKGWGWARWRGTDLKPYGKDAKFTNECVSCHEPVAKNDYVYTMPIGGQQ